MNVLNRQYDLLDADVLAQKEMPNLRCMVIQRSAYSSDKYVCDCPGRDTS